MTGFFVRADSSMAGVTPRVRRQSRAAVWELGVCLSLTGRFLLQGEGRSQLLLKGDSLSSLFSLISMLILNFNTWQLYPENT